MKRSIKALSTVAAAVLLWSGVGPVTPAGATVHSFDAAMTRGRFIVHTPLLGSYAFDTPGGDPAPCPSTASVSGEIDDAVDEAHGETVVDTAFEMPILGGYYVLHTESNEVVAGTWHPSAEVFTGMLLDFEFTVHGLTVPGCTLGDLECSGDMQLEVSGGLVDNDPLAAPPPFSLGDEIFLDANPTRAIATDACSGIWDVVLPDAMVEITDNPFYGDPGALFEVT